MNIEQIPTVFGLNWQWLSTFAVLISFIVGVVLWGVGYRVLPVALTVGATVLATYVIYAG